MCGLDGKILAGGTVYTLSGVNVFIGLGVVRFNSNGSMDSSFGNAGLFTSLPFQSSECAAGPLALQPDGKILLAGSCTQRNGPGFSTMVRLTTAGNLDAAFGSGGVAVLAEAPKAIALQSDGNILVAGGGTVSRYNTNGNIDSGFGIFGSVGSIGTSAAITVQGDGKILVAGTFADQLTVTPDDCGVLGLRGEVDEPINDGVTGTFAEALNIVGFGLANRGVIGGSPVRFHRVPTSAETTSVSCWLLGRTLACQLTATRDLDHILRRH